MYLYTDIYVCCIMFVYNKELNWIMRTKLRPTNIEAICTYKTCYVLRVNLKNL